MVLIKNNHPGRRDGNYTRVFGDAEMGSLISAIHGTSISMGRVLEEIIRGMAPDVGNEEIPMDDFFDKIISPGIYIISKKGMTDSRLKFDHKADMVVINVVKNSLLVLEVKLGDNFDTKKTHGEVISLKEYSESLKCAIKSYRVSWAVCFWFADNKASIVKGFKGKITEKEALTGREFCNLINISFDEVNRRLYEEHQEANREFVFDTMGEIFNRYHPPDPPDVPPEVPPKSQK